MECSVWNVGDGDDGPLFIIALDVDFGTDDHTNTGVIQKFKTAKGGNRCRKEPVWLSRKKRWNTVSCTATKMHANLQWIGWPAFNLVVMGDFFKNIKYDKIFI